MKHTKRVILTVIDSLRDNPLGTFMTKITIARLCILARVELPLLGILKELSKFFFCVFDWKVSTLFGLGILWKSFVEVVFTIFFRCESGLLLECLDEMTLGREGEELRDVQAGIVRVLQHVLGGIDLLQADEVTDRNAGLLLKQFGEICVVKS